MTMASVTHTMHNSDLSALTMTIKVPKVFYFRVWLGTKLMTLGAKITGVSVKVDLDVA